jgi:hypothetical protein
VFKWSPAAVQLLISLKAEYDSVPNAKAYQLTADKMGELGHAVDKTQVANKWKYLVSSYKTVREQNSKSGNSPATCPYYDELDRILAPQPNITPVALSGNRLLTSSSLGQTQNKRDRKRKSDEPEWVEKFRREGAQREEAREKRHRENMDLKREMLQTYEKMMQSMIDKM